jgi:hypothetical protein
MTAAYRIVAAERNDLAVVTVVCDDCSSAIALKIETAKVPEQCASCGKPYSENIKAALAALGRFHREASTAETKAGKPLFRFEIRDSIKLAP